MEYVTLLKTMNNLTNLPSFYFRPDQILRDVPPIITKIVSKRVIVGTIGNGR
jgi:hypothetical protein